MSRDSKGSLLDFLGSTRNAANDEFDDDDDDDDDEVMMIIIMMLTTIVLMIIMAMMILMMTLMIVNDMANKNIYFSYHTLDSGSIFCGGMVNGVNVIFNFLTCFFGDGKKTCCSYY